MPTYIAEIEALLGHKLIGQPREFAEDRNKRNCTVYDTFRLIQREERLKRW